MIFNKETSYLAYLSLDTRELIDLYVDILTEAIKRAINVAVPYKRGSPYDKGF